jgi:tetratricopeptide (TPR) repeat protein
MPKTRQALLSPCILALLILTSGCSLHALKNSDAHVSPPVQQSIDPTCAYYYFLIGSRAEYEQNLDEALEMYRKAVACDPTADYINEKIPILLIRLGKIEAAEKWLQTFIAKHPDKNTQRILLADINIHNGNIPAAIRLYREAQLHDPESETLLLRLGLLYSQQKDYKQAEEILTSLLKKNDKSYFANLYLARVFNQAGNYEKAAQRYESALDLNWSKELVLEMADFYSQYKKYDKALLLYQSILAQNKKDEQASLGLIQTYLSLNREKAVFTELARLRTFTKDPVKIDLIESRIYINLGKPAKAEKLLLSLLKKKKSSQAQYLLAVTYFDQKKLEKSLQTLRNIDPASEQYEDGIFLQLRILRDTKRIDQALALLQKTVADKNLNKPIFYMLLASLYQEKPDLRRGIDVLKEGIALYPDNDQLYFELAITLEKAGKHDQSMEAMEKVLQLKPDHPEALNFIGYSWADANINLNKALAYIKRAILQRPDNGFIRDSLGWVYFRLRDYHQAVDELQKAVSQEPNDPHILEHLGDAYAAMGQKSKAVDAYIKALHLSTQDQDKNVLQKKIEALKTL